MHVSRTRLCLSAGSETSPNLFKKQQKLSELIASAGKSAPIRIFLLFFWPAILLNNWVEAAKRPAYPKIKSPAFPTSSGASRTTMHAG